MICACLPAIRALLSHKLPKIFDLSTKNDPSSTSPSHPTLTTWNGHKVCEDTYALEDDPGDKKYGNCNIDTKEFDTPSPSIQSQTKVGGQSEYSESRTSVPGTNSRRESDEVQFLDVWSAIPLRRVKESHIATNLMAKNSQYKHFEGE